MRVFYLSATYRCLLVKPRPGLMVYEYTGLKLISKLGEVTEAQSKILIEICMR